MIQPPRRSVTRFFIPMIDVLTLLFCIFLLMPFVDTAVRDDETGNASLEPGPAAIGDEGDLAAKLREAQLEIDRLKKEQQSWSNRLEVRTLEIDGKTGELVVFLPERKVISSQGDAAWVVNRHREELVGQGDRLVYYQIIYPRDPDSPFPTQSRVNDYKNWFAEVPHGFEMPRGAR